MEMLKLKLTDGSVREYAAGVTGEEIAKSLSIKLAKEALGIKLGEEIKDLMTPINESTTIEILTQKNPEGLEIIRHSTAHLLAQAVQNLWPATKIGTGPVIKDGFYYDFLFPENVKITEDELVKIEKEMQKLLKTAKLFQRKVYSRKDAEAKFSEIGEHLKLEIVQGIAADAPISVYSIGDAWFDLCSGPHVPSTKFIKAFKLLSLAGSYWRADEKNAKMVRIYGTAWYTQEDLQQYLDNIEEAKKRDHRILGKKLDLFSFHPEAPAMPFFHPKGAFVYESLKKFMQKSNSDYRFEEVGTPLLMNVDLWHQSGHYGNYKENMYFTQVDDKESAIKPMNCPGHCLIYKSQLRSYRQLPLRMSEFGRVHRHERSGVTHGLFRVRSFVQDDAHVFCTVDQIHSEVKSILKQIDEAYRHLGFPNYRLELSTRPAKSIGSEEMWTKAESALQVILEESALNWKLNPGDGAFYGPKIDFHLIDSLGRSWQCGTVQLDFSMPERFGLEFTDTDNTGKTPVMIHRAVLGSLERFMGILIENCGGRFPMWLAPEQVRILTLNAEHAPFAHKALKYLEEKGVRAKLDERNERLNLKIREAQIEQIPLMIVIGDKECEGQKVSGRKVTGEQLEPMSLDELTEMIQA
jgi:threonyl-tRNA synthetase